MNAAALAERLSRRVETVSGVGFVTLCPESQPEKVTTKNHSLTEKNAVCDLVPVVTPFFVDVEDKRKQSRSEQATNDQQALTPATTVAAGIDWRQADAEYLRHHFTCSRCCTAGHGRGDRCPAGADLWAAYGEAWDAVQSGMACYSIRHKGALSWELS